jgi:hypothetical protein
MALTTFEATFEFGKLEHCHFRSEVKTLSLNPANDQLHFQRYRFSPYFSFLPI